MPINTDFLITLINEKSGSGTARISDIPSTPPCLIIDKEKLTGVCQLLKNDEGTSFELLECISGVDNGPEAGTMEVIYNLYSVIKETQIALRVILARSSNTEQLPEVESVSGIWRTADWLERETYDLLGIHFKGHPDLRRILLPTDWNGYPMRKDYKTDEYYHNVKIDF